VIAFLPTEFLVFQHAELQQFQQIQFNQYQIKSEVSCVSFLKAYESNIISSNFKEKLYKL